MPDRATVEAATPKCVTCARPLDWHDKLARWWCPTHGEQYSAAGLVALQVEREHQPA